MGDMMVEALVNRKRMYTEKITQLFQNIDCDSSGEITIHELEECLQDDQAAAYFAALEVDVSDAWTLFKLIDNDESGVVELQEFVEGCLKLKGPAQAIDLA